MKKYNIQLGILITIGIFISLLFPIQTKANVIELKDLPIKADSQISEKKPLTNTPIELIGPRQEINLYYEVKNALEEGTHRIVFELENSSLLIAPSSVTVKIDSTVVETRALTGEAPSQTIVIPLNKSQLANGIHEISLIFQGIIKEGVCVDQYNAGNWLSIGIDSYIEIFETKALSELSFSNYPEQFLGTEQAPLHIVLPQKASMETLQNGLVLASYLNDQTNFPKSVQIVREQDLKAITGNLMLIGAYEEFNSNWVKQLFESTNIPPLKDEMYISQHTLTDQHHNVQALIILGNKPEDLTERLEVLTNQEFYKQFAGNELRINSTPVIEDNSNRIVPLKKFGMTNLLLNGNQTESSQFFYFTSSWLQDESATLELYLKKSETIRPVVDTSTTSLDADVELTILVNGVPYSVDIRQLNEEKNGYYTVQIPIESSVFQENQLVSLQFKAAGLRKNNPCVSTDDQHWLYISEDSFISLPPHKNVTNYSLAGFPNPFVNQPNETIIVLPEKNNITDDELFKLYSTMTIGGKPPRFKLMTSSAIQNEELKNHHLIFIGGLKHHSLLQKEASNLLVSYKDQMPLLQEHGFLTEMMDQFAWIQPNLWNENKYFMLVMDQLEANEQTMDATFLTLLAQLTEPASIATFGKNKQIYTNNEEWEAMHEKDEVNNTSIEQQLPTDMKWIITAFVALIVVISIILWITIRKTRKQKSE